MEDVLKLFMFMFYATAIFALIFGFASKIDERNSKIRKQAVSHYKGSVVLDKADGFILVDSCGTKFEIRATDYELSLYELGDTIK